MSVTTATRAIASREAFTGLAIILVCALTGCASSGATDADRRPRIHRHRRDRRRPSLHPQAGLPNRSRQLRLLHVSYWGFDDQPHVGTMVVNANVTDDVLTVFSTLYSERFPISQMVPEDAFQGSDPSSMAADNTSGFNCRYAVAPGSPQWSAHAFGEAIDVNPVENPYLEGGTVQPDARNEFLDRSVVRPGVATADGPLVAAFASVGWLSGGRWTGSPDSHTFRRRALANGPSPESPFVCFGCPTQGILPRCEPLIDRVVGEGSSDRADPPKTS